MSNTREFKRELKELLKKYNADIWVDLEGDTHGVSDSLVFEIDNKEVMRFEDSQVSHHDIKL